MTPARRTLGVGRASTTKPASAAAASTGRARRPTPSRRLSSRTAPATMATFVPLTGGEVRQADGPEVLTDLGQQRGWCPPRPAPAADRAPPPAAGRQRRAARPAAPGRALHRARPADQLRRPAPAQDGSDVVAALGRSEPALDLHALARQQPEPAGLTAQDDDRGPQPVRPAPGHHALDAQAGDDQRGPPRRARQRPSGVVQQHRLDLDGRLAGGQPGERPARARTDVDSRHQRGRCAAAAGRRRHQDPAAPSGQQQTDSDDRRDPAQRQQHPAGHQPALPGHQPRRDRRGDEAQVDGVVRRGQQRHVRP